MTPYMSLRQSIRPAITAYQDLADDEERAARLLTACEALLVLLKAPELPAREPVGDPLDAVTLWAEVIAASTTLATALVRQGNFDQVRRLADFFADAGERAVAANVRAQVGEAVMERCGPQLRRVTNSMPPGEIKAAIAALRTILRDVPEEAPGRNAKVNAFLPPIAASMRALMKEVSYDSRVEHIASGGVAKYHDIVEISVGELASEFEETWPE
jgi:hypothetical protein